MASTASTLLRLELQAFNENTNDWGDRANSVFERLEEAIAGAVTITTANGDVTLTTTNYAENQARKMILRATATLSDNLNIIVPALSKVYVVSNETSGAYSVTVKVIGQTGVTVPQGEVALVFCDGTTTYRASPPVQRSDGLLAQANVSGLVSALAGKSDTSHLHTGVYSPVGHTHTKSNITDLADVVGDSGSGGTQGLVPAPPAGSAAELAFLGAGGTFLQTAIVQVVYGSDNTATLVATSTPIDNTIPQSGEGQGFFSTAITPKSSSSDILCLFHVTASVNTGADLVSHFHVNGAANATHSAIEKISGNGAHTHSGLFVFSPASTSEQTVQWRVGIGSAANVQLNQDWNGDTMGGTAKAHMVLAELKG